MIKLYTTVSPNRDYVGFNNIIKKWEEYKFIERVQVEPFNSRYISWLGKNKELCIEPSNPDTGMDYQYCLCCQYRSAIHKQDKRIVPLNLYARDWNAIDIERKKYNCWESRTIESLFSGTIRGDQHTRNKWTNSTTIWSTAPARTYNRTNKLYSTQKEYYEALHNTRFGLCLGGDGGDKSACQREIEVMLLGCIPVFDKHVSIELYEPLVENKHYLLADNPEEMRHKINALTKDNIDYMLNEIQDYAETFLTPEGIWQSIIEIIEAYNIRI